MIPAPTDIVNALYGDLFERGVRHFLPSCHIRTLARANANPPAFTFNPQSDGRLEVQWGGLEYEVRHDSQPLTSEEGRIVAAVSNVLAARYRSLFDASAAARGFGLFRGLPEDHYVSAYLDPTRYLETPSGAPNRDRISDAIDVLRIMSLTTYENRRVSTGALLLGSDARPCPAGAAPYTSELAAMKSFHRLSDGRRTVFLVNPDGKLVDLVDVNDFARSNSDGDLPAPTAATFQAHARATLHGDHICLVLTPNGEIKIWAEGVQQLNFLDGRWRLTEAVNRYRQWAQAIGDEQLANLLFTVALNRAEARRGGMFVVVEDAAIARQFVSPIDLLFDSEAHGRKDQIQYLMRGKRALDLAPTVLETMSRLDGAIVLDKASHLLAFGAILRHDLTVAPQAEVVEGSRTTAALESSKFGSVLKISEDGLVSFYKNHRRVWEI